MARKSLCTLLGNDLVDQGVVSCLAFVKPCWTDGITCCKCCPQSIVLGSVMQYERSATVCENTISVFIPGPTTRLLHQVLFCCYTRYLKKEEIPSTLHHTLFHVSHFILLPPVSKAKCRRVFGKVAYFQAHLLP